MRKLLFIFFILFSASLLACEEVNFYDSHPFLNELPITNQGSLNACYSHTLSTVYNLEFGKDETKRLHPFWTAFIHKNQWLHWQPMKLDYSLLSLAWNDVKRNGYCRPSDVDSVLSRLKQGTAYSDSQLFFLLSKYFQVKGRLTRTEVGFNLVLLRLLPKLLRETSYKFEVPWSLRDLQSVLSPIREGAQKFSFFEWMDNHVFKQCRDQASQFPGQTLISFGRGNEINEELAKRIEFVLANGKPLSVGYCYRIFQDPEFNAPALPRVLKLARFKCGAHYSTLVGSRKRGNSCEYLIRNSYGTDFWAQQDFTCLCRDRNSGLTRDCVKDEGKSDLEVLGCWIERERLLTNTFDISYFK